jgi:hypothetical protein
MRLWRRVEHVQDLHGHSEKLEALHSCCVISSTEALSY